MTLYSEIYEAFKDKITDYDFIRYDPNIQNEILYSYLRKAVTRFRKQYVKNDTNTGFIDDLSDYEIDIITEWMVSFWIYPYLNNEENMKNILNTSDYNMYSPANLLDKLLTLYETSRKRARSLSNEYSFINSDIENWKS